MHAFEHLNESQTLPNFDNISGMDIFYETGTICN